MARTLPATDARSVAPALPAAGLGTDGTRSGRSGGAVVPTTGDGDGSAAHYPVCDCGEPLKPGVVLFGEGLPEATLGLATRWAGAATFVSRAPTEQALPALVARLEEWGPRRPA